MADVVVDASTAAKWQLLDEQHVERAELLLQDIENQTLTVVVPEFWNFEVASILSKAVANSRISESAGLEGLNDLLNLDRIVVPFPDAEAAFTAARRFNRSVYDCFYLIIAEERGCPFRTDDRKLARALAPHHPFVRWIGDYPDPTTPAPA